MINIMLLPENRILCIVFLIAIFIWIVSFILLLMRLRYLYKKKLRFKDRRHKRIGAYSDGNTEGMQMDVEIANLQHQGMRDYQEDAFGISDIKEKQKGILAVLADGMGGMAAGKEASTTAVNTIINAFNQMDEIGEPVQLLLDLAHKANDAVSSLPELQNKDGGTTLILCYIKDYDMHYLSVGDSRICLYRDNELIKLNQEHILANSLDEMVRRGEMDYEEAMSNPMRTALTSYIGADEIPKIDYSESSISLIRGDRIILMSDGVFGDLNDEELVEMLGNDDLNISARLIEHNVLSKRNKNQDNFTAIIIAKN